MKKYNVIPALLFIYLGVMSYIGWDGYASGQYSALYYFGLIALTLLCIFLLRQNLIKRDRKRKNQDNK